METSVLPANERVQKQQIGLILLLTDIVWFLRGLLQEPAGPERCFYPLHPEQVGVAGLLAG